MQEGFIKLHRCILDSSWSRQPDFVAVWVYCLLRANYNPADIVTRGGMMVHLEPGQFITSREQISIGTGVQESKVERILKVFKSEQQIEQQNKGKFRIISILNWQKYQAREQQNEQQTNNKRTTDEQQMNTNKKVKKGKEGEENPFPSSDDEECEGGVYVTKKKRRLEGKRLATFLLFWEAFGYKRSRAEAADAWLDIPKLTDGIVAQIVAAAQREASSRPDIVAKGQTPKMAQGWISGRRWEDEAHGPDNPAVHSDTEAEKQIAYLKSLGCIE